MSIAVTQMLHFGWLAAHDQRFSLNKFLKAFFEGQDVLDELQELFTLAVSTDQWQTLAIKSVILLCTSLIIITVHVATSYSILNATSQAQSILASIRRFPAIITWTLIETGVFLTIATHGFIGGAVYLVWQLATIFVIPLIADNKEGLSGLLKTSWRILKKKMSDIIGGNIFTEFTIFLLGALISIIHSPEKLPEISSTSQFSPFKLIFTFSIIYLASIILVAQTIFLTEIYEETKPQ
jgi:hypothetical protein